MSLEVAGIDPTVFMIAPGEVFFVPAGATVTPENGPAVSAPSERNVVLIHVVSTYNWAPILTPTGQPVAEWWALENVTAESFEAYLDARVSAGLDLATLAEARGYATSDELRAAILSGGAGLNVLLAEGEPAGIATLAAADLTLGIRAWAASEAGLLELDASSALASFAQLAPSLEAHPLLAAVLSDVSTRDVTIHVRFVYWSPNAAVAENETDKGSFVSVADGSKISLQKRSGGSGYTTIVEGVVAANGQVALVAARADLNAVNLAAGERLVFRVDLEADTVFTPQYQHKNTPRAPDAVLFWSGFQDAWVTEGRSTKDEAIENLDFLVNYPNAIVGTSAQPIEYYAGLPVFLQVTYPVVYTSGAGASAKFETLTRKAPKGLLVEIRDAVTAPEQPPLGTFRTDEHGQVWGMLLNGTDSLALPLEVSIKYEIEDADIGLPKIEGEVVEGGNPAVTSYSSNADPRNAAAFSAPLTSSVGKPFDATQANSLATVQVGFVTISGLNESRFDSVAGRHAGVLHALQQLRYIHQFFHHLTSGFTYADGAGQPVDESWISALARHNNTLGKAGGGTIEYPVLLPKVRVTVPKTVNPDDGQANLDESLAGEVAYDGNDAPNLRWWLILYGFDQFSMNQQVRAPDPETGVITSVPIPLVLNRTQFWRVHTIWHEFTHAVVNMALNRLLDLDTHTAWVTAKDGLASGRLQRVTVDSLDLNGNRMSGGWSTLEEGLAAVPEALLMGKVSGMEPTLDPSDVATPRHVVVDVDAAGNADGVATVGTDLNLSQGLQVDLNRRTGLPVLNDRRLGLRVPIAFTWGMWHALAEVGGFDEMLAPHTNNPESVNDLADVVAYLSSAKAQEIFQALFWGPLIASRTPNTSRPRTWNDLTVPAVAPTTFSFMQAIQANFWNGLSASDQAAIKALSG